MPRKTLKPLKAKLADDHPFFGIIEDAYQVFAYPKPTKLEVCEGCCMEPEIEADFFTPDIRELPLHYVQDWFFAAYDPPSVSKAIWAICCRACWKFLRRTRTRPRSGRKSC